MKDFEEQYTAWVDGLLNERDREAFEAGLPDRAAALRERAEWEKLRGVMRGALAPAAMPHADFLNHQVLAAIGPVPTPARSGPASWFPIGRLAWSGALLLVLAGAISAVILPRISQEAKESPYISQVIAAHSTDPKLGAYAFAAPGGKGAVLWIQDAGDIPANERIR